MIDRIPHDTTKLFSEVFESANDFVEAWKSSGLYDSSLIKDSSVTRLFYLLYARFGNSSILNWDVNQFKYKVYANIVMYGPTWEKRVEVQKKLRELDEEELRKGSKAIYNSALNPEGEPSTDALEEIQTINKQDTTNYKKSKLEGYAALVDLLETDVTKEFIDKFKPLFATFVHTSPDIYITDEEEDD